MDFRIGSTGFFGIILNYFSAAVKNRFIGKNNTILIVLNTDQVQSHQTFSRSSRFQGAVKGIAQVDKRADSAAPGIGQEGIAIYKAPQGFEIWSRSRPSDFALTFFRGLPITLRNNKEKSDLNYIFLFTVYTLNHIRSNASLENRSCWNES